MRLNYRPLGEDNAIDNGIANGAILVTRMIAQDAVLFRA